jgi:hypothetical protein
VAYLNNFLAKVSQGTREAIMRSPEYRTAIGSDVPEEQHSESHAHANVHVPDDAYSDDIPF